MKNIKSIPRLPITTDMLKKHYSFYKKHNEEFELGVRLNDYEKNEFGNFVDNFLEADGYNFSNFNDFKSYWNGLLRFGILINGQLKKEYTTFEKKSVINDFNSLLSLHNNEKIEIVFYLKHYNFPKHFVLLTNY